jgi:beta-lactamase regulating signal transducer with metallopeptidase domain
MLNWLWQGSVVAIAAAAMLRFVEPSRARIRYVSLWVALATILLLPAVPLLWAAVPPVRNATGIAAPADAVVSIPRAWWTSSNVAFTLWAIWTTAYAVRVARAALALRRARRDCPSLPAHVEARLRCWSQVRATGRRTRLVVSPMVKTAALLGGRGPLIAVAPALIGHLSDEELDRVVIHEWAHVQRRDDITHFLQMAVRVLAGWHPAVWWCNRQLDVEREVACDETAVAMTGSTKEYAACLTRVASFPSIAAAPLPAVVALLSTSGLRVRIVRILAFDRIALQPARVRRAIAAGLVLGLVAVSVGGVRAIDYAPLTSLVAAAPILTAAVESTAMVTVSPRERIAQRPAAPQPQTVVAGRRSARLAQASPGPVESAAAPPERPSAAVVPDSPAEAPPVAPLPSRPALTVSTIGLVDSNGPPASTDSVPLSTEAKPASAWSAAADAGAAIGRGSQDAAVATAGFFNRLSRKIAGSF